MLEIFLLIVDIEFVFILFPFAHKGTCTNKKDISNGEMLTNVFVSFSACIATQNKSLLVLIKMTDQKFILQCWFGDGSQCAALRIMVRFSNT